MTFCREVKNECSAADYYLKLGGDHAWFCHGPVTGVEKYQTQHELYALMIIIQVIQLALGTEWLPDQVRLQSHDDSGARVNDYLLNTNIEFGAAVTAARFPKIKLTSPLKKPGSITTIAADNYISGNVSNFPEDPIQSLKELITAYTLEIKNPTIDVAADVTGVSKRTLQRYLSNRATSYNRLVDEVKYEIALPLLQDSSTSITDIARTLGYSNIAHFSRAFKRITGVSPRAYRKLLAP